MNLTKDQGRLLEEGTPAQRKAMEILLALGEIGGAESLLPITSAPLPRGAAHTLRGAGRRVIQARAGTRPWERGRSSPARRTSRGSGPASASTWPGRSPTRRASRTRSSAPGRTGREALPPSRPRSSARPRTSACTGTRGGSRRSSSASLVAAAGAPSGIGFDLLGLFLGERAGDGLPYVRGFRASEADLKWFGAALASAGSCGMFHLEGVTPEWRRARTKRLPTVRVTADDLEATRKEDTDGQDADLIALGSPQLSSDELRAIAGLLDRAHPRIPVWVFTSRAVREANPDAVAAGGRAGGGGRAGAGPG